MVRTIISWVGMAAVGAAVLAILWPSSARSPEERRALAEGRTIITYWDRHSGHEHEIRKDFVEEFNTSQDGIYVRMVPIGERFEKLLTAIATGAPPEICSIESNSLDALARQGCFMPLDDFVAESPDLSLDAFFPHAQAFMKLDGHVYGIPTTTDTYCLLWNKDAFRRAGLDPERPPSTIEELQEYATKLTVRDGAGVRQLGFLPWLPWDLTPMWMGLFGAEMYNPVTDDVHTAKDPDVIACLRWMQQFAIAPGDKNPPPFAIEPNRFQSYGQMGGAYKSATNPFYTGRVAMITEGEWQVTFVARYAPSLDWGVAPLPQPEGAEPRCFAPSCVLDAIPLGCREPEAAKAFLRWFYSPRPGGGTSPASDYCFAISNIPPPCGRSAAGAILGRSKIPRFRERIVDEAGRHLSGDARGEFSCRYPGPPEGTRDLPHPHPRRSRPRDRNVGQRRIAPCAAPVESRRRMTRLERRNLRNGLLFASPYLLGFLALSVYPLAMSVYYSFTQFNAVSPPVWVGGENFRSLFEDPVFWKSLQNTFYYTLIAVPAGMALSVSLALLLNQNVRGMAAFRTIFFLPSIVPVVASGFIWLWIFNPESGLINGLLREFFGIEGPGWMADQVWAKPSLIIMSFWSVGGAVVILLAGLTDVPSSLYEVAELDGANRWQTFRNVTLPMLTPTILFNLVMGLITSFQYFTEPFVMTGGRGTPADSTMFYALYMYRNAFVYLKMGYASAMAWMMFVVILVSTVAVMVTSKRWVYYHAE